MVAFFRILLLLLIALKVNATDGSVNREIFITPQLSSECPSIPCPTINEVVEHYEDYFTSNTTLNFLSGNHTITNQSSIALIDVEHLTLVGSEDSVIQCTGEFSFTFFNITALNVSRLRFIECEAELPNNVKMLRKYTETFPFHLRPYSAGIFVIEAQKVFLSFVTVDGPAMGGGIYCLNVFSAFLSHMTFIMTEFKLAYRDTHLSNYDSVAYAKLTKINFSNSVYSGDTGLYAIIDTKRFPVIMELDDITVASFEAYVSFNVNPCSNFMLHASNLTLVKIYELSVEIGDESCTQSTNIAVHFEHITIESYMTFLFTGLLNATVRDMRVYNTTGMYISIENSIVGFNETYITNNYNIDIECTSSNISFYGSTLIAHNEGADSNILHTSNSTVFFSGNVEFTNNTSTGSSGVIAATDNSNIILQGNVSFLRNSGYAGAIAATKESIISFQGKVSFIGNRGNLGGAIGLYKDSYLLLHPSTHLLFKNNTALTDGGAIYISVGQKIYTQTQAYLTELDDNILSPLELLVPSFKDLNSRCFFSTLENYEEVQVIFDNNIAGHSGLDIYGGSIDTCIFPKAPIDELGIGSIDTCIFPKAVFPDDVGIYKFNKLFNFTSNNTITSDPTRVCLCEHMRPNCYKAVNEMKVFPGQEFSISVAAVGQYQGTTPGIVYAEIRDAESQHSQFTAIPAFQKANLINGSCTNISYTAFSQNKKATLILTIKLNLPAVSEQETIEHIGVDSCFLVLPVHVTIAFKPCPLGFVLKQGSCICLELLEKHKLSCDIATQTVHKKNNMWIGTMQVKNISEVIVVHNYCPFDYCNQNKTDINLERQDEQCALNHAGTLCGKCRANLSRILGPSKCELCDNTMLVLLPVFMICGVVLVILLIHLNLTVSIGTINGLIFYANIIQANRAAFFPNTQSFLSIFIAWLNLDFGIETCFYNGLDTYTKTWLQFVFPLYIWLLVIVMIVWSHYSTTGTKLVGNNAVFALATLFLISYAKLVRNIVAALSFTVLQLPNSTRAVWLYDANIEYFSAKHAPLFVVAACVLLFVSVPYTALLIFAQCLLSKSHKRMFRWVQQIKPLLDAYTGPYKDKHRYWTGLLLLVRVMLFLVFSANYFGDPETNLIATVFIILSIVLYNTYIHGPYKSMALTMIETSLLLNMILICSTRLYQFTEQNHIIATNILVSIVFATFCGIIIYHTYLAIKSLRRGEALIQTVSVWCRIKKDSVTQTLTPRCVKRGASEDNDVRGEQPAAGDQVPQAVAQKVTTTIIELREPLLASQEY